DRVRPGGDLGTRDGHGDPRLGADGIVADRRDRRPAARRDLGAVGLLMARGALARALALPLGAVVVACSFPSVTFAPEDAGGDVHDAGDASPDAVGTDGDLD